MGQVVSFGSYNLDLVARVPRFPAPGETLAASDLQRFHGGKGANQAIAARRAGARASFAGCVGADDAGAAGMRKVFDERVVPVVRLLHGQDTGTALILVAEGGENQIVIIPGANALVDRDLAEMAAGRLGPGDIAVGQLEVPMAATAHFLRAARDAGALTLLNAAPGVPVLPDVLDDAVDILVVNQIEARALAGSGASFSDEASLAASLLRGRRAVVVTLGSRGAVLAEVGRQPCHQPAPPVRVVDTTGAGDAFIGAFCAALARRDSLRRALADGVVAGSLACATAGALPSFPSASEIKALRVKASQAR